MFQALRKWGLALLATGSMLGVAPLQALEPAGVSQGVGLSALPAEGQATDRLIRSGGPFPFNKDGTSFGNRERRLPREARGYYREYTVPTPGAHDRGARRIVCGGRQPTNPDACYYTDDHYTSFHRIVP